MAYRTFTASITVADDSSLVNKSYDRKVTIYQTLDLEAASPTLRVGPTDAEAVVSLGSVVNVKSFCIMSDYPIRVRLNGATETQLVGNTANVPAVSVGAPLPPQFFLGGNVNITSIRVQPIASAAQTATVWINVTGDPLSDY